MKVVYEVGKNREANAHIQVLDNRDGSFESHEGDRDMNWATLCVTHGNYIMHRTRMLAEEFAHHPTQWCEVCEREGNARAKQSHRRGDTTPNGKDARREIDRKVYIYLFENWALYAKEIAAGVKLDAGVVAKSLNRLKGRALVDGTHVNEDKTLTWQTYFDVENGSTEEEALAAFEEQYK